MFDLETRLRAWRQEMAQRLAGRDEVLDELENHLREAFLAQQRSGRSADEAWAQALARLGDAATLAPEFAKVTAMRPLRWAPALVVVGLYMLAGLGIILPLLARGFTGPREVLLGAHVVSIILGYLAMLGYGLLAAWLTLHCLAGGGTERRAACLRWWGRPFAWTSLVLTVIGFILGGLWAQATSGAFWTNDPREFGGMLVILWNVAVLFVLSRRRLAATVDLLAGLGGNIAIGLAWFGAAVLAQQTGLHSYGFSQDKVITYLAIYVLGNVLLMALALWPIRSNKAENVGAVR
jgi:hypothetical protein